MNLEFTRDIRELELAELLEYLPEPSKAPRLLELGAGSGWQSKVLSAKGWQVTAIDVKESPYVEAAVFPVKLYDGHVIPYPNAEFDVVFSSNVLEHVPHLDALFREIYRVLKPGGLAIHILPSASWRLYTSVMHYPAVAKLALSLATGKPLPTNLAERRSASAGSANSLLHLLRKALYSGRHGERGTELAELYYFSRYFWYREFDRAGFSFIQRRSMALAYSGYSVFGPMLPFSYRRVLSKVLGASCHLFLMRTPTALHGEDGIVSS